MNGKVTKGVMSALVMLAAGTSASANPSEPTCSDTLPIEVHGQHVVGDYVSGIGHDQLGWPPEGGEIGQAIADNGGAMIPGGPGPGFHFEHGFAPGASFCTESQSPGLHL